MGAAFIPEEDIKQGKLYPDLKDLRTISAKVAARVAKKAIEMGVGSLDVPDILAHIKTQMYFPNYEVVNIEDIKRAAGEKASALLHDPYLSRGTCYTQAERAALGIDGL